MGLLNLWQVCRGNEFSRSNERIELMIGTKLSKTTLQMFIVARSVMFLACAALTFSGNKKAPYCAMGVTGLII